MGFVKPCTENLLYVMARADDKPSAIKVVCFAEVRRRRMTKSKRRMKSNVNDSCKG